MEVEPRRDLHAPYSNTGVKSPTGREEQSGKELPHNSKRWDAGKVDQ